METTERKVKIDGDVEISQEAFEKIGKDAIEEYTKEIGRSFQEAMLELPDPEAQQGCLKFPTEITRDNLVIAFDKFGKDAIEEYKKEIGRSIMRKDYQCSTCKSFPRPENAMSKGKTVHTLETVTHCSICSNVFCLDCIFHTCSDGLQKKSDMSRSLESASFSSFEWNLEFRKLPYFCENAKFGCQENFFNEEELYKHEKYCSYQRVHCVDIECEEEVCLLDYLEHFKSTHGNSENCSNDKTFHLPIELDILQEVCTFTKFTVFGKTFFDVSVIRRKDIIFKWIYSLCLPEEAELLFYRASLTDKNDEKVATVCEQVRSMVESPDSIIEGGNCFILGVQKAKRYAVDGGNKVNFSVQITSLKDEDEESGIDD